MDDTFISVPNWTKFQHYKDRSPSWIKVYTDLNSRDEWLGLTWGQRGLLVTAWLEYARSATHLRSETLRRLGSSAGSRYFQRDLEALNHAGFLLFPASTEVGEITKDLEPQRDPDALQHIRDLANRIGRQ
jgi:hypothetical protein